MNYTKTLEQLATITQILTDAKKQQEAGDIQEEFECLDRAVDDLEWLSAEVNERFTELCQTEA